MREFVIDNDLRIITPPEGVPVLGVEHDANVHRIWFSLPRMYGDVDLSTFEVRVNYRNANRETDMYVVTDANASEDHIEFSWLVGRHALQYKGKVQFIVCLRRMTADGEIEQELNTTLAELPVLEGLEAELSYYEEETARDVIQQLLGLIDARGAEVLAAISGGAPAIVQTASGSIVSIKDGVAMPAVELISHIEPYQAGSGDPSPDNVRPISGRDSVVATRTGSNLAGTVVPLGITSETQLKCDSLWRSLEIPVAANTYYTISRASTTTNVRFRYCFTAQKASLVGGEATLCFDMHAADTATAITVQAPANAQYMYVYVDNTGSNIDLSQYTVNVGQQAAAHEPYEAQTLTAELPETVYGGDKNWTAGVLTVDCALATFDGSSAVSLATASTGMPYISTRVLNDVHTTNRIPICSSSYKIFVNSPPTGEPGIRIVPTGNVFIYDERFTDINTAKSILDAEQPQIVYKIAEPYTIQLTPQQLTLLKGNNTVWSSTGDTELTYVADTKSYIDQKFAELQNAILAQGANI